MGKLSVAIATYNEEKNIKKCLESIRDLADEIVIVDGSSTDQTVEIAKEYGAKVKVTDNPKIFHINKQKAIDMARGDWILQLDADERVSKSLAKEISDVLSSSTANGYYIPRKNYFLGRFLTKGGQYPDYTLRLYRKGKGRLPQLDVHEQAEVEGEVGHLKNPLLHYPYKNFKMYLSKWWTYTGIESTHMKKSRANSSLLSKIIKGAYTLLLEGPIWFLWTYIRHKGFVDGWQGLVFSFFSSLRIPTSYIRSLI